MGWPEFLTRTFGWLLALIVFLFGREMWQRWKEKRSKQNFDLYSRARAPAPHKRVWLSGGRGLRGFWSIALSGAKTKAVRTGNWADR